MLEGAPPGAQGAPCPCWPTVSAQALQAAWRGSPGEEPGEEPGGSENKEPGGEAAGWRLRPAGGVLTAVNHGTGTAGQWLPADTSHPRGRTAVT